MHASIDQLQKALPKSLNGWELEETVIYGRDNLYDYINGGAELYLSFGFQSLLNLRYQQEGQPDIVVDVFDMDKPDRAFGIFTHSREVIDSSFGQGSQYTAGFLLFWKGPYYISILASPETETSRKTVFELADIIDQELKETGKMPVLVNRLPQDNLIAESIRYFNHPLWVNTYYFLTEENVFNLTEDTRAVLARYRDRGLLLILEYPDNSQAQDAFIHFQKSLMPEASRENLVKIEDETWLGGQPMHNCLLVVFNCQSQDKAADLLQAAREKFK